MGPLVPIAALAMAFDASWAVTVAQDGTIRTLGTGAEPRVLPQAVPVDDSRPVAVALADHGLIRVVWAAEDGLGLYENADGDEPRLETFPVPAPIRALAFSPSGRIAIAGCADGTLLSLDTATGEFGRRVSIGLLPAGALAVASDEGPVVAITPDGNIVLALGAAGILYRWNVSLGRQPHLLELDEGSTALAVDSTGDKGLIGMPDGSLWLHDLAGGSAAEFGQPEASFPSAAQPSPASESTGAQRHVSEAAGLQTGPLARPQ